MIGDIAIPRRIGRSRRLSLSGSCWNCAAYNLAAHRSPDVDERVQAPMALVFAEQIYCELRMRHMNNQAAA